MVINRTSTSLVQFLGASVIAKQNQGKLSNIVIDGLGGEKTTQADVDRLFSSNLRPASINIAQYQAALGHLQTNGSEPLTAKAMAVVLVDVAEAQGVNVMSLIKSTSNSELALVENSAYKFINQLRDGSSQLGGSKTIDNTKSLRSRYILG